MVFISAICHGQWYCTSCREVFLLLPSAYNLFKQQILFHQHCRILQCLYFIVMRINTEKVLPSLIAYVYPLYSKAHTLTQNENFTLYFFE